MKSNIYTLAFFLIATNHPFFGALLVLAVAARHLGPNKRKTR